MIRSGLTTAICVLLTTVKCARENAPELVGRLSPQCVEEYYNVFINRNVPARTYLYHHEEKQRKLAGGIVDIQWRIVGGQQIDIKDAPFSVLYGMHCGGILIAPQWALTAAHCRDKEQFIIAGSTKISQGTRYNVCAHFMHPLWSAPNKKHYHDYDYQLLLLELPVPVSERARPIAIGSLSDIVPGAMVSVTGWGHISDKVKHMENHLRQVSVPIIPDLDCAALPLELYSTITPRMFCAGYKNGTRDSCQGDSGGPAVLNGKLIGLVSFGMGCAAAAQPGVYAIVPLARPWIREITGLPL